MELVAVTHVSKLTGALSREQHSVHRQGLGSNIEQYANSVISHTFGWYIQV